MGGTAEGKVGKYRLSRESLKDSKRHPSQRSEYLARFDKRFFDLDRHWDYPWEDSPLFDEWFRD